METERERRWRDLAERWVRLPAEGGAPAPAGTSQYGARYQRARKRVEGVRGCYIHPTVYLVVNLCMCAINMLADSRSLWFYWPLLGWGPLADRGARCEERTIREYMEKDR
jgi:hypothetical protein